MKKQQAIASRGWMFRSIAIIGLIALSGCSSSPAAGEAANGDAAPIAAVDAKPGAQLWAENCTRCHNLRSPVDFTPAQWSMVVHEMRVRAGLTGEEQRKILAFLQAGSR